MLEKCLYMNYTIHAVGEEVSGHCAKFEINPFFTIMK
jgi:hypothetical protein